MKSTKREDAKARPVAGKPSKTSLLRVVKPINTHAATELWTDTILDTSHGRVSVRQTTGRKMPLMLLHGHLSSKEVFRRQMDGSAGTNYHMIAIDLPGHGASGDAADPTRSYTITGYADVAVEVLEMLGIDHAALFGWSLGGHIALEMMARFPGTTGVMISGAPPVGNTLPAILAGFKPHPHLGLIGKAQLTEEDQQNIKDLTMGGVSDEVLDQAFRRTDSRARARMADYLIDGSVTDHKRLVETNGIPVAVVNGADDPIVNVDYLGSLSYAKLWSRRCYLIPRTRHAPFLDQPDIFNDILMRFLRRMEGRLRAQLNHASLCFSG